MTAVHWLAVHEEDGAPTFRIGRAGDLLVAEWVGQGRLLAQADGSASTFEPEPDVGPEQIEKIRRGGVTLLLRHLQGRIALHGAAVGRGGRAVALLGRSGHGKSTLAAALCARAGGELYADDALAIDEDAGAFYVLALEENHWIDEAARAAVGAPPSEEHGKAPVRANRPRDARAELTAFVDLAFSEDASGDAAPVLTRLSGVAAISRLVPQAVRFAIDDGTRHVRELDALAAVVARVPVYSLVRPRDLARMPETLALLEPLFHS